MTQEQYNRYMDGLVLKVASKKLNKTASIAKKAGMSPFAKALLSAGGAMGAGVGSGYALKYYLANQNDKEAQPSVPEMSQNDKSWLDAAKDYGKQGVDWVKAQGKQGVDWARTHPYITGGVATAALAAGLVGAYLLRKNIKKNTKTASFRKVADAYDDFIERYGTTEQKFQNELEKARNFKLKPLNVEFTPGLNANLNTDDNKTIVDNLSKGIDFSGLSFKPYTFPAALSNASTSSAPTPKKSWLDAAKDYGKQGVDWVKTHGKQGVDWVKTHGKQGVDWAKENPVKAGLIGAAAVGIPAALIYAYYSRKNNKSKKSKK